MEPGFAELSRFQRLPQLHEDHVAV